MGIDSDFKVFSVTKAAGHFLDGLDSGINSFTYRIGDSMLQVGQNITQVFTKHPSHLLDRVQPGTNSPGIPGLKVFAGPAQRLVVPQLPKALFDSPGSSRLQPLFPPLPTSHRSFHQVPGLIPAHPQQPGCPLYVRLLQYLYRQPLKKHRKQRMSLHSTHLHLPDTMHRTINPRYTSAKIGLKLTGVQMTPDPLRRMIIHRKKLPALRTWPANLLSMNYLNIYTFLLNFKFHLTHFPRLFNPQNLAIKSFYFHKFANSGAILSHLPFY